MTHHAASATSRVAIIGGGIIGCATAHYLSATGSCTVTVIEAEQIASGASGYSAGILTPYSGSNDPGLLALSPAALQMHRELADSLPDATGIDHGYALMPFMRCGFSEQGIRDAEDFLNARQSDGLDAEWLTGDEAREVCDWLSMDVQGACLTEIEPSVDSMLLTQSLWKSAEQSGRAELRNRRVTGIESSSDGRIDAINLSDGGRVEADVFVFAAGPWSAEVGDWLGFEAPVQPQKGQLLHIDIWGDCPERTPPAGMQNMDDGGVVVPRRVTSTVLGATREDGLGYDRVPTDFAYEYILPRVQKLCPRIDRDWVTRQTACLRPMPADGKPYVGLAPGWDNAYIAAGHWSEGVHYGPLTAKWLTDTIAGGESEIDVSAISADRLSTSK